MHASISLPFALAAMLLAATAASAEVKFDAFLAGLDRGCTRTPAFEAFQTALSAYVPGAAPAGEIPVPDDVAGAIGEISPEDAGDHVRVAVALAGTFSGLKLARVMFYFGKENGIYGWAVEFDEPAARLRKVLGKAVERGNRKMASTRGTDASTGLDVDNGRVAIFCDFSN